MPSRYPAAREAEERFHSRYGRGPSDYVVADYTARVVNVYDDSFRDEPVATAASLGPRPSTAPAPAREKSSSSWRQLNKYAPLPLSLCVVCVCAPFTTRRIEGARGYIHTHPHGFMCFFSFGKILIFPKMPKKTKCTSFCSPSVASRSNSLPLLLRNKTSSPSSMFVVIVVVIVIVVVVVVVRTVLVSSRGSREQKKEMRHHYEPVMGGTGDDPSSSFSRPGTAAGLSSRPSTARAKTKLPSCSSVSAVMEASTGHHRDAGPFTPRAGGLASTASSSYLSTSSSSAQMGGAVKGVPPPKWANKSRFEPSLGGTTSGKQSRMQAYKENRLAQGGYFSATVAGSCLVAKSHNEEPLSGAAGGDARLGLTLVNHPPTS